MAAKRNVYRAVFGHVGGIGPGALFESRQDVKVAKLHKAERDGISTGLDEEDKRAADAIVLSKGYEDDLDQWDEVLYTGAGGRDEATGRQVRDQSWDNSGNAGLRRSQDRGYRIRVIRGSTGERSFAPVSGYRYDGLYEVVDSGMADGRSGFKICQFKLHRLPDGVQEITSLEQQVQDLLDRRPPRRTSTVERIVRDTAVVRRVKQWHNYTCQVCGLALAVGPDGESYAEGAHIQALGGQDGGPDVEANVLCLCPNCHVRLDRGALYLTDDLRVIDRYAENSSLNSHQLKTVGRHSVEIRFIRAHRRLWNIFE